MKVAIVGLGGMGSTHYNLYREMDDVQITALVDVEFNRVKDKARECGAAAYTDIHEMLKQETPDFVDICTPSYLHCEQSIAVMEKGIHILVEKPAALNETDVNAMLKRATDKNVFFMAAHVLRFWPEYIWLKNTVEQNLYGKLMHLNMWRYGLRPLSSWQNWMMDAEKSGLVPYDLHVHDIDFMVYLLGAPQKSDMYDLQGSHGHYVETTCYYENGTRVQAKAAWNNSPVPFQMGYEAMFEHGYADYKNDKLVFYHNNGEITTPEVAANFAGSEINVANTSGYFNEIRYFIDCIAEHKPPSIIKGEELLAVVSILNKYK